MKRGFKRAIGLVVSSALAISLVVPIRAGAAASTKTAYLNSRDETTQISCVEVQGVPVPYVAVDECYNIVYDANCSCEKFGNDTYKFDNGKGLKIPFILISLNYLCFLLIVRRQKRSSGMLK